MLFGLMPAINHSCCRLLLVPRVSMVPFAPSYGNLDQNMARASSTRSNARFSSPNFPYNSIFCMAFSGSWQPNGFDFHSTARGDADHQRLSHQVHTLETDEVARRSAGFGSYTSELCWLPGVSMSSPGNPDPQLTKFTRRSETESICVFCFLTVRADRYVPLEEAEDIHADVCLLRPDSPVRYALL